MVLLGNIFKRTEKKDKDKKTKDSEIKKDEKKIKKQVKKTSKVLDKKSIEKKNQPRQKKIHPFLDKILISAQITEKATLLAEKNQYIFKVGNKANKPEIKKAVEQTFGVSVENVKIIRIPGKRKKVKGRLKGIKGGYKKAIVKLVKGQSIELLPR